MNKILVVIDAQEDFVRGSLRNEEAIKALPILHKAVKYAVDNKFKNIIYTHDTHDETYPKTQEGKNLPIKHCIRNTPGWELCPEAFVSDDVPLIHCFKTTFGYDNWRRFEEYEFKNINEIWICGFCTDICVSANFQIIKAAAPDTPIVIIEDACAGVTPELHEAALKVMGSCQARVVKWAELEGELRDKTKRTFKQRTN